MHTDKVTSLTLGSPGIGTGLDPPAHWGEQGPQNKADQGPQPQQRLIHFIKSFFSPQELLASLSVVHRFGILRSDVSVDQDTPSTLPSFLAANISGICDTHQAAHLPSSALSGLASSSQPPILFLE